MNDEKRLQKLLKEIRRSLPRFVADLRHEFFIDTTGDLGVRIWIVIKEGTSERNWSWDRREPVRQRIKDLFEKREAPWYPYILFRSEAGQAEIDEHERKRWAGFRA